MTISALSGAVQQTKQSLEIAKGEGNQTDVSNFEKDLASLKGSGRSDNYRNTKYDEFLNLAKEQKEIAARGEISWEVDRNTNTIKLDNGYQIKLDENKSQLTLEKLDQAGKVERTTRIWGDPHIDVGNNGKNNADFYKDTSLLLEDGTKITIGTQSKGGKATYSDQLTISRGEQGVKVTGLMSGADALQISDVAWNGKELDSKTNDGHLMFEKGAGWSLSTGETISQKGTAFKFAETETKNEFAWGPTGSASQKGTEASISASLMNFLKSENIRFSDQGKDGLLSEKEWDKMIESINMHRGLLGAEDQSHLSLILSMIDDFDKVITTQEDSKDASTSSVKAAPTAAV